MDARLGTYGLEFGAYGSEIKYFIAGMNPQKLKAMNPCSYKRNNLKPYVHGFHNHPPYANPQVPLNHHVLRVTRPNQGPT